MSIALKISRHKPIIKLFSGFAMIVQAVNTENIPFFEANCSADLLSATMVSSASDGLIAPFGQCFPEFRFEDVAEVVCVVETV